MTCAEHAATIERISSNTKSMRWFIGTFLVVVLTCVSVAGVAYAKSMSNEAEFNVYVAGQNQRLKNVEATLIRIEKKLDKEQRWQKSETP